MCLDKPPHVRLGRMWDAEPYNRGNDYIIGGYRVGFDLPLTMRSLFFVHNEFANIWTHLVGLLMFFYLMFHALNTWLADGTFADKAMFLIWCLSAQILLFSSTFFHLTGCLGPRIWRIGARMDYTSISVLIVGSYFPMMHYLFQCHPFWKYFYIAFMAILGIIAVILSTSAYFQTPEFQGVRASMFVLMGVFGVICAPHFRWVFASELDIWTLQPLIFRLLMMGGTYIGGAVIYATKVPEKWWPGRFDNWWHSHMIWHIFVVAATLWHYSACEYAHYWRNQIIPCSLELAAYERAI